VDVTCPAPDDSVGATPQTRSQTGFAVRVLIDLAAEIGAAQRKAVQEVRASGGKLTGLD
jgi:hypothetical protein